MRALRGVIVVLALALPVPLVAADLQAGLDAYERGDYATALVEWVPLAEQGHADAQFYLGILYDLGIGVPQDYAEAVKWYRLAVEQGNANAQNNLGVMYHDGDGVTQDYAEAVKWYRPAADQGMTKSQINIGFMHQYGKGVTQDYVQAHKWYNIAASRLPPGEDRDMALSNRDLVEKQMTPDQITEAERLAREWKPK